MNTTRRGFFGWLAALFGGCYAAHEPDDCVRVTSLRAENDWQPVEADPACEYWASDGAELARLQEERDRLRGANTHKDKAPES